MNKFFIFLGMLGLVSCGQGLPDPTLVKHVRVLAIKAEPPEVRATTTEEGEMLSTELSVLAVMPANQTIEGIEWYRCSEWQLNTNTFTCAYQNSPREQLGQGFTYTYVVDVNARLNVAAERAMTLAGGQRLEDIRLVLEVQGVWDSVNASVTAGSDSVESAKRVVLTGPAANSAAAYINLQEGGHGECEIFGVNVPVNQNPVLQGVQYFIRKDNLEGELAVDGSTVIPANRVVEMFPKIDWSSLEAYPRYEIFGATPVCRKAQEVAYVSWFCDAGSFSRRVSSERDPNNSKDLAGLWSDWTPPKKDKLPKNGVVFCWVVLRDGRGGTNWQEYSFHLE